MFIFVFIHILIGDCMSMRIEEYRKKFRAFIEAKSKESNKRPIVIHYSEIALALNLSPSSASQWLRTLCVDVGGIYNNGRCIIEVE